MATSLEMLGSSLLPHSTYVTKINKEIEEMSHNGVNYILTRGGKIDLSKGLYTIIEWHAFFCE